MKQEIKAKWVSALRSGAYEQGTGYLKVNESFCCLGVLCDLHAKETSGVWKTDSDAGSPRIAYKGQTTALPFEVLNWAGLDDDSSSPVVIVDGEINVLATLNDTGSSFLYIANLIEKNL